MELNFGDCFCCGKPMKGGYAQLTYKRWSLYSEEGLIYCRNCHDDPSRIDVKKMRRRMAKAGWRQEKIELVAQAFLNLMMQRLNEMKEMSESAILLQAEVMEFKEATGKIKEELVLRYVMQRMADLEEKLQNALLSEGMVAQLEEAIGNAGAG